MEFWEIHIKPGQSQNWFPSSYTESCHCTFFVNTNSGLFCLCWWHALVNLASRVKHILHKPQTKNTAEQPSVCLSLIPSIFQYTTLKSSLECYVGSPHAAMSSDSLQHGPLGGWGVSGFRMFRSCRLWNKASVGRAYSITYHRCYIGQGTGESGGLLTAVGSVTCKEPPLISFVDF